MLAYVEEQRPRVVHVATPGPVGVCGLVAARLLDLPVVGSYHTELGPYTLHLTQDLLVAQAMDLWVDWFYRQCRVVLAPTHHVADALRSRGHANVGVWGRGVDSERFTPERRRADLRAALLEDGDLLLLSVGRVSEEKRLGDPARRLRACSASACPARGSRSSATARRARRLEATAPPGVRFLGELRGERARRRLRERRRLLLPEHDRHVRPGDPRGRRLRAAGGRRRRGRRRSSSSARGETGLVVPPDDPTAFMHALAELAENETLRLGARRSCPRRPPAPAPGPRPMTSSSRATRAAVERHLQDLAEPRPALARR